MRTAYIAGNWKMHKTISQSTDYVSQLRLELQDSRRKIMVAPPFTALHAVADALKGSNILLGAQNMSDAESGAHTGEISPLMLKDLGVHTVILGHSERRHIYKEDSQLINRKIQLALKHSLEVIVCVGETLEKRNAGKAEHEVFEQLRGSLVDIGEQELSAIVIAYEPVWAIGTGVTATPNDADAMHKAIRSYISDAYSPDAANSLTIQYGGSVKPNNIADLMRCDNIDGALVGGASLQKEAFVPIVQFKEN